MAEGDNQRRHSRAPSPAQPPALAQRFPFERSFDATSPITLDVSTVRGKINVTVGDPGSVVVTGTVTVRAAWDTPLNAVELAKRVAASPPIRSNNHTYRVLIGYAEGRPPLGEFFNYSEAAVNVGFRIDF